MGSGPGESWAVAVGQGRGRPGGTCIGYLLPVFSFCCIVIIIIIITISDNIRHALLTLELMPLMPY